MRTLRFACALACWGAALSAQPWGGLPSHDLTLRPLDPHPYHKGELIRMEAKPPTPQPGDMWQFAGILLDPAGECGTVPKPCWGGVGGRIIGGIGSGRMDPLLSFGNRPEPVEFALNPYLPSLAPGRYRTALLARRLVRTSQGAAGTTYGYSDPAQYAVSNSVDFEIVPDSAAWVQGAIVRSVAVLRGPKPVKPEEYEVHSTAAQQLRFLDDPAAWAASLDLLPEEEYTLLAGLGGTAHPARVCELMQSRIAAPEQMVTTYYLSTLEQTCTSAHVPPPPKPAATAAAVAIAPVPPAGKWFNTAAAAPDPAMQAYFEKLRAYQTEVKGKAAADLAASLPGKQPAAKTTALATLLEYLQSLKYSTPKRPAPAWVPALTREFIAAFPSTEVWRQQHMLSLFASSVRSPELVPLLESVLDRWKPGDYYEAVHTAVRALYNVAPARARERILTELVKPQTWLDTPLLELLPPSAVPPMDEALINALATAQRPGGWNPQLSMAAIAKYATAGAEPRIRAIYESQQEPCQPELMAYFVRVAPAYADRVFHSHPWDMQADPPRCTVQYFNRTAPLAMAPALEKYVAAYLMHRNVFIKTTAAQSLGLYGSSAALPALWDAFRYFHEYWKSKPAEVNGEGAHLEVELRNAIARGRHWLANEEDLRTIESLCISDQCRYETRNDIQAWHRPLGIDIVDDQAGGIRATVAQYYGIGSLAALDEKLAQFPRGTQFLIHVNGVDAALAGKVHELALKHGLVAVP